MILIGGLHKATMGIVVVRTANYSDTSSMATISAGVTINGLTGKCLMFIAHFLSPVSRH